MKSKFPYKRILLKLSGEILLGSQKFGISPDACRDVAGAIAELHKAGLEVGIVIGGGNIFRGINLKNMGMQQTPADQMGMLATLINGMALQQSLESMGCPSKVMSALECPKAVETYNWSKALEYLKAGTVLVFVGGTGNPYFTTDSAAALRASEIHADVLLKATKVDGIYNKDPIKHPDAVKYDSLTYSQFLAEKLEVMDATAIALCRNSRIPIFVFNMSLLPKHQELINTLSHSSPGTLVKGD